MSLVLSFKRHANRPSGNGRRLRSGRDARTRASRRFVRPELDGLPPISSYYPATGMIEDASPRSSIASPPLPTPRARGCWPASSVTN